MEYKTKQREWIIGFLEAHHDDSFTVSEIKDGLAELPVSVSAIYRNLAELEKDGKVRKASVSGSREAHYQYVDCPSCRGHVHVHCLSCGKTTHLDDEAAEALQSALSKEAFALDAGSTVLYGVCDSCAHHKGERK